MTQIAVVGAGSWGTALAGLLAGKPGFNVRLWARSPALVEKIMMEHENSKYLAGVELPHNLDVSNDLEQVINSAEMVVMVTPSHGVRSTIRNMRQYLQRGTVIVSASKGIEPDTLLTMTQVMGDELPAGLCEIAVLSGPSHAEEVGRQYPTTVVAAARSRKIAEYVQDIFMTPFFRVYTNPDVMGVELAGSLKNIIALCAGMSDGLGFGDNTKAALMTRGIAEIARLGIAMGARPLTFAGLAGVGDLIVTCTSKHSRNRRAGIDLANGKTIEEIQQGDMVVEGIRCTLAANQLRERFAVPMPIAEQAYATLYQHKDLRTAVIELMMRAKTHETEEIVYEW